MPTLSEKCSGYTAYISVGDWAGFYFGFDGPSFNITLGWVCFVFVAYDVDKVVGTLHRRCQYLESKLENDDV